MNYKVLKEIIVLLKQKMKCPGCSKNLSNKEIDIIGIQPEKLLIKFGCKKCHAQTLVEVLVVEAEEVDELHNETRIHQGLQVRAHTLPGISQDEVLDIHNFLKSFSGDFKTIFKI